jgi:hypothetical protein
MVTIGRYTLDVAESLLACGNEAIPLRPQVLRAIEAVATGGRVPRKQLATAIWGADADDRYVGNPLDQVISDVRGTLMSTPDLRLERSANGYWLKVLDVVQPPASHSLAPGEKFPLDYLLEPHVRLANCELTELQCTVAAPEPLELKPRFARALFEQIAGGARMQMLLPAAQARKIGTFMFHLIGGDGAEDLDRTGALQERFNRLVRNLRLTFTDEALLTGLHVRFYGDETEAGAIAVVLPPGLHEAFVYSKGVATSQLRQRLQAKILSFDLETKMIGISGATASETREELEIGVRRAFAAHDSLADQIIGRCR